MAASFLCFAAVPTAASAATGVASSVVGGPAAGDTATAVEPSPPEPGWWTAVSEGRLWEVLLTQPLHGLAAFFVFPSAWQRVLPWRCPGQAVALEVSILLVVALVWGEVSYSSWVTQEWGEMVEGEGGGEGLVGVIPLLL